MARKKRRVAPAADEDAARRKFLEALEAQRANARRQSVEKPAEPQAAAAPAAVLPGFYYDEAKKRYFRSSPASERRQREQLELQQREQSITEQNPPARVKFRRGYGGYGVHGHNWVDYLAQRQSDFSWSARGRDGREFMPQFLSGFLPAQEVQSQEVHNDGRLTALALHPRASNLGAIGASSGRLDILGLRRLEPEPGMGSPAQSVLPIARFDIDGVITELEWRPVRELDLLVCSLGSGRRDTQRASGGVSFMRVGDQGRGGRTVMSDSRMKGPNKRQQLQRWLWRIIDCGVCGCGGAGRNYSACTSRDYHERCTRPELLQHGSSCAKWHELWGWDVRCPSRIYEWAADVVAGQPAGSVLDVHVLNDSRRAVVQRSNGELRLLDLRNCKPVVEFVPGLPKRYLQNLRCAVDTHESVVVAGGDTQHPQAVNTYELQHGRCVASVEVRPNGSWSSYEKRSTLVQQVQLKPGLYAGFHADTPEIWALSRNELYICSGWTNDPTE